MLAEPSEINVLNVSEEPSEQSEQNAQQELMDPNERTNGYSKGEMQAIVDAMANTTVNEISMVTEEVFLKQYSVVLLLYQILNTMNLSSMQPK